MTILSHLGYRRLPSTRRAISLIESAFVLLVTAAALAGAASTMMIMLEESDARVESSRILRLADNVRSIKNFNGYGTTARVLADLKEMKLIPEGITVSGNTLKNHWGGTVQVVSQNAGGHFAIGYTGLPPRACRLLLKAVYAGTLFGVSGGAPPAAAAASAKHIATLTAAEINAICSTGVAGTVYWSTYAAP